jgi:hypothetical protein
MYGHACSFFSIGALEYGSVIQGRVSECRHRRRFSFSSAIQYDSGVLNTGRHHEEFFFSLVG